MPVSKQTCDPIRSLYVFTVSGKGGFPIDMLRYDSCWPRTESGSSVDIAASLWRSDDRRERTVQLIGTRPPTEGRWESFGWKVL